MFLIITSGCSPCACCYSWISWQSQWHCTRTPLNVTVGGEGGCVGKEDLGLLGSFIQMLLWSYWVEMLLWSCKWRSVRLLRLQYSCIREQHNMHQGSLSWDDLIYVLHFLLFALLMSRICSLEKLWSVMEKICRNAAPGHLAQCV